MANKFNIGKALQSGAETFALIGSPGFRAARQQQTSDKLADARLATDKARQASFERQGTTQPITLDALNKTLTTVGEIIQSREIDPLGIPIDLSEEDLQGLEQLKLLRSNLLGQIENFFSFDPKKDTNTGTILGGSVKETVPDDIIRRETFGPPASRARTPRTGGRSLGDIALQAEQFITPPSTPRIPPVKRALGALGKAISSPTLTRPLLPGRSPTKTKTKKLSEMTLDELRAERKRIANGNSN